MTIKKADSAQYQDVRLFYHSLIDAVEDFEYSAGWKKDIYPSPDFLKDSIDKGELFIVADGSLIIGAMVLNHEVNDGYREYQWPTEAEDSEVTVIHALGVHPLFARKGYARKMVEFAIDFARGNNQKVIRLDVLKGNIPAKKLYEGIGFRYLHTLLMFYEDTGFTDYELYEYVL